MLARAVSGSSGGGSVTTVESPYTFVAGENTITVSGISNIKAVLTYVIFANGNGGPNYAYLDDSNELQQSNTNTSIFKINAISGNTFTYAYNAAYAPSLSSSKYIVIGT